MEEGIDIPINCKLNTVEWQVEKIDLDFNQYSFVSDRFVYVVVEDFILVHDTFFGTEFLPKQREFLIWRYIHLCSNYGFALYGTDTDVRLSVVLLDPEKMTFEVLQEKSHLVYELRKDEVDIDGIYKLSSNLIGYKTVEKYIGDKLHILDLCNSKFNKKIRLPDNSRWFHFDNGKIAFIRGKHELSDESYVIKGIDIFDEHYLPIRVENSGTKLRHNLNVRHGMRYGYTTHGCWDNCCFFILYHLRIHNESSFGPSSSFFAFFDMDKHKWTQIKLNLERLTSGYLKFNICDGILTTMQHFEQFEGHKLKETHVMSSRFALGKPEKLYNLALFTVQKNIGWNRFLDNLFY